MQYIDIYSICQPVMDWLKENYPHNHKIVIDTNSAIMFETGKLIVLDKAQMEIVEKSKDSEYMKEVCHDFFLLLEKIILLMRKTTIQKNKNINWRQKVWSKKVMC